MTDISASAARHLESWRTDRVVFGLMGEFSAGKSTLANFLIGSSLLPENVTATQLPPVWATYGTKETVVGLRHDGALEQISWEDLEENARERYLVVRLTVKSELLQRVDLVDTPGLSDPDLAKDANGFLGSYLDFVVWCSSAIQAWRYSEKTAWLNFPEHLRKHSLVVLTRSDKVRNEKDLRKVLRRVSDETVGLFAHVLPLDTPSATKARTDPEKTDLWNESGAFSFMDALDNAIKSCATEAPIIETSAQDTTYFSAIDAFNNLRASIGGEDTVAQAMSFLNQIHASIINHSEITPKHRAALEALLYVGDKGYHDAKQIISQVEAEFRDFDTTSRYRLFSP